MATEITKGIRVNEGLDETSYAKTSYIQNRVMFLTKPIKEEALRKFYYKEQPTTICIADMGCSSAKHTLDIVYEFIDTIEKARKELENGRHEYQVYLNDLPENDFITLFSYLRNFEKMVKQKTGDDFGSCFIYGAPGTFYGRLFPSNHLHFVHSSYSIHQLSQVRRGIEDNKRNIYIGKTSPPNVLKAYYKQFENDFLTFLRCRSKEVKTGGVMVLTILGRKSSEPYSKESCYMFEILAKALNDMVHEGLIEEEKLNTFNIPAYCPSVEELCFSVEKEGSFTVNQGHVSEVSWGLNVQCEDSYKCFDHNDFARCMRSVIEPFLINHFGDAIIEELFCRYGEILKVSMSKEEKNVFINVTIQLTRKGRSI